MCIPPTLWNARAGPLNVTDTAKTLGYANRPLLERRLARLHASFATLTCPQRDDAGDVVVGSQAKTYLSDPLLAWLPSRLRHGLATPDMTQLTEMSIGVALAHAIDELEEGRWLSGDTIGYALGDTGTAGDVAPAVVRSASDRDRTCR